MEHETKLLQGDLFDVPEPSFLSASPSLTASLYENITQEAVEVQDGNFDPRQVADSRKPVLIRGSQTREWPLFKGGAFGLDGSEVEARRVPSILGILPSIGAEVQDEPEFVNWNGESDDQSKKSQLWVRQPSDYPREEATWRSNTFDGPAYGYTSTEELHLGAMAKLHGFHLFRAKDPVVPGSQDLKANLQLWMSQAGVTARTHFDTHHNFFVQLAGTKQVLLAPPAAADALRIYPRHHASRRQSQVPMAALAGQPLDEALDAVTVSMDHVQQSMAIVNDLE